MPKRHFVVATPVGGLAIGTTRTQAGTIAFFTSVEPRVTSIEPALLRRLMRILGISEAEMDPSYPPRLAFTGTTHSVIVLGERSTFDDFTFEPAALRAPMDEQGWKGTVTTAGGITVSGTASVID